MSNGLRPTAAALAVLTLLAVGAALRADASAAPDRAKASAAAHAGLSDAAAWKVAQRHLPEPPSFLVGGARGATFGTRAAGAASQAASRRPVEYLDRHTARLAPAKPGGAPAVVISSAPLQTERNGQLRPIDLSLERGRDGTFKPRNAQAAMRLAPTLASSSVLTASGVRMRAVMPRARRVTAREGNRAFFANAARDADVALSAERDGFEVSWVLRSGGSPETMRLRLSAPRRIRLTAEPAGGFAVVRRADSKRLAVVRPAVAWDARRRPLKVEARIAGQDLLYRVAHRGRRVAYPVVVDPVVETWGGMTGADLARGWAPGPLPAGHTASTLGKVFWLRYQDTGSSTPSPVELRTTAPRTMSSIVELWRSGYAFADACGDLEIRSAGGIQQGVESSCAGGFPYGSVYGGGDTSAGRGNLAVIRMRPDAAATSAYVQVEDVRVVLEDYDDPAVSISPSWTPSTWRPSYGALSVAASASDQGLGVMTLSAAGAGFAGSVGTWRFCDPRTGTLRTTCPTSRPMTFTASGTGLTEGIHTATFTGTDPASRQGTATAAVRVDATKPTLALAGALLDATPVTGTRALQIDATDDVPGDEPQNRRAGVGSLHVEVDGVAQTPDVSQTCDHSCPLSRTFAFDPRDFPDGTHDVEVTATDQAGNVATERRTVSSDVRGPELTLSGPLKEAEGHPLTRETYRLDIAAKDGSSSEFGAGVEHLRVVFDDGNTQREVDEVTNACDTNSCGMKHAWTLESAKYPSGTVRVQARDKLGHTSEATVATLSAESTKEVTGFSGLEEYMHYDVAETGAGSRAHVNLTTGNLVWNHLPLVNPGRGLATFANVTYNAQTRPPEPGYDPYDELGDGFSLGISGLTRLNEPLDVTRATSTGVIVLVDPDGTRHEFKRSADGSHYEPPPGVNLHLRRYSTSDDGRAWAITRPDGTTFFFDRRGFQTLILDRNENVLRFEYEIVPRHAAATCPTWGLAPNSSSADDCRQRVAGVTDSAGVLDGSAGRTVKVAYSGANGPVTSLTDHGGRVLAFVYSGGRLTTMTQASGTAVERSFRFFYGAGGLVAVQDPRGASTRFTHNPGFGDDFSGAPQPDPLSDSRVTALTLRNAAARRYTYGREDAEPDKPWSAVVEDARGHDTDYRFDHRARPFRIEDARGAVARLRWDGDNNVTRLVEAEGTPDETVTDMGYNENGLLTRVTDGERNRTELGYRDGQGTFHPRDGLSDSKAGFVSDLLAITTPKGTATGAEGDFTTWFTPDDRGNVTSRTDAEGNTARTAFDPYGQITSETDEEENTTHYRQYDASGRARVVVDPKGGRSDYRYDAVGNLLATTDARAEPFGGLADPDHRFQARFSYDAVDQLVEEILPKDSRAQQFITRAYDYDPNGNERRSVDGNRAATIQTHDEMDDVVVVKSPAVPHVDEDQPVAEVTRREYDEEQNLVREEAPRGTENAESRDDFATTYAYDALGQMIVTTKRSRGRGNEERALETSMAYDLRGNVIGLADGKRNEASAEGPVETVADPAKRRYTFVYDKADRRTHAVEDPAGLNLDTKYVYDRNDNLEKVIDPRAYKPNGTEATYTSTRVYDRRDLLTDEIDPLGRKTHYERRDDGRVIEIVSPRGTAGQGTVDDFRERLAYDELGAIVRRTLPKSSAAYVPKGGHDWIYERDAVGNPIRVTDPRGNTYANAFYDTGDVRWTTRPGMWEFAPGSGRELAERSWREIGNPGRAPELPSSEGEGDFGAVGGAGSTGLLPKAGRTEFAYDAEMRLTSVAEAAVPAAEGTTTLERDAIGRVLATRRPLESAKDRFIVDRFAYDRNGNRALAVDPAQQESRSRFDQFDRLVERTTPPSGDGTPDTTRFSYDANGQQTAVTDPRGNTAHRCYDAADRLVRDVDAEHQVTSYGYDAAGNPTEMLKPKGQAHDPTPSDCAEVAKVAEHEKFQVSAEFDAANQMTWRREGPSDIRKTSFAYDVDGNQIKVEAPGAKKADDDDPSQPRKIVREFDARGLLWSEKVGEGENSGRTTVTEYDGNGNLRRRVNAAGVTATGKPAGPDDAPAVTNPASPADQEDQALRIAARNATVHEYSADNLLTTTHLPNGSDADQHNRQSYVLDGRGRVTRIDAPNEWTRNPRPCSRDVVDPKVDPKAADGSPACVQQRTFTHFDNGWIRTATEPGGRHHAKGAFGGDITTYDYDPRGLQTLWQSKTATGDELRRQQRAYWPSGLLKQRSAQKGDGSEKREYDYRHSSTGQLTSVVDRGNDLAPSETRDDRAYRIAYDKVGRRRATDEDDSRVGAPEQRAGKDTLITYDRDGNATERRVDGRLNTPVANGLVPDDVQYTQGKTSVFVYDEFDREVLATMTRHGVESEQQFATDYWDSDAVKKRTERGRATPTNAWADRGTESFYYFDNGDRSRADRRDRTAGPVEGGPVEYAYDDNGNPRKNEWGEHAYNARDQLTTWKRSGTSQTPNTQVSYALNGSGDVLQENDTAHGGSVTNNSYAAGRLVESKQGSTTTAYAYEGVNVKSTKRGDDPETTFTYDAFDRLSAQQVGKRSDGKDERNEYAYDAFDRRDSVKQTVTTPGENGDPGTASNESADFSYIGLSESLSQRGPLVESDEKSISLDYDSTGEQLGMSRGRQTGQPDPYLVYAKDANGSVVGLLNDQGKVATADGAKAKYAYDPYGNAETTGHEQTVPGGDVGQHNNKDAQENPFRFQGFYLDSGVKTYDMRARMYLPQAGRFLTQDRFEDAAGDFNLVSDPLKQNRYAFAGGNPVSNVEFDGHDILDDVGLDDERDAVKKTAKGAGKGAVGAAKGVGKFGKDAGEGAAESLKGTVSALKDPEQAAKGAAHAVTHPKETAENLAKSCDGRSVGNCVGYAGAELVGGKGAGAIAKGAAKGGAKGTAKGAAGGTDSQSSTPPSNAAGNRSGGCNSFVAGTPVLLADGRRVPIESVRVGDRVLATDTLTGDTTGQYVVALIRGAGPKRLVAITVGGRTTIATAEHPYWLADDRRWVDAEDLEPGDLVRGPDGTTFVVETVRPFSAAGARVYNLSVATTHTYYAGSVAVLVHNADKCPPPPRYLYRNGNRSQRNLTPRAPTDDDLGDPDGVSTYDTIEKAIPEGSKGHRVDTTELKCLEACEDKDDPGHFGIRPRDDPDGSRLQEWMRHRDDGTEEHAYTKELRKAMGPEKVKNPKKKN